MRIAQRKTVLRLSNQKSRTLYKCYLSPKGNAMYRIIKIRHRDVEWARQWLSPGIYSVFGYVLKRNAEYGLDTYHIDIPEQYAILRQSFSKHQIERIFGVQFDFGG
jgi:hypothetical protein